MRRTIVRPRGFPTEWFEHVEGCAELVTIVDSLDRIVYTSESTTNDSTTNDSATNESTPAVALGAPLYDLIDPEFHEAVRRAVADARRTGLPHRFDSRAAATNGRSPSSSNWAVALGDGAAIGSAIGSVAVIAQDITEQDRIGDQLELSELTLRSLVDNSPDAILIVDRERRILFVNRNDYGFDDDDVLGRPAEMFVPEGDRQRVVDAVERVLSTGEPYSYTTGFTSPVGERHFVTRVVPIPGRTATDRLMLVATDVTAQLEVERETEQLTFALQHAQKLDSLGQLTSGVAHDFNNILVAISGNLELARMSDNEVGRVTSIEAALDAVEYAKTVTGRLLAFSRKQSLRPQPIDVGVLVAGLRQLLARTVGETIRVTVQEPDAPTVCTIDPAQLESAVINLVVNARDAMPDGGEISIVTRPAAIGEGGDEQLHPGEYVVVEVTDRGQGMTPEVADRVFEPFFTTKEERLGTGLGLSMVHGFVRQSGGHVQLRSKPGCGTTIRLFLRRTRESPAPRPQAVLAHPFVRGHRELVLVVDVNEQVRSLTAALLDWLGYRTIAAGSADDSLALVAGNADIDLVVTEVALGDEDGFALAERARALRPGLSFLFVSGYPYDALDKTHAGRGADAPLTKPYTAQQLADAVHRRLVGATPAPGEPGAGG